MSYDPPSARAKKAMFRESTRPGTKGRPFVHMPPNECSDPGKPSTQGTSRCHVADRATKPLAARARRSRSQRAKLHAQTSAGWFLRARNDPSTWFGIRRRI